MPGENPSIVSQSLSNVTVLSANRGSSMASMLLLIDMNDAAALGESQEIISSTFSVKD